MLSSCELHALEMKRLGEEKTMKSTLCLSHRKVDEIYYNVVVF